MVVRSACLGGKVPPRETRTSSSSQTSVRPKSWADSALLLPLPFLLLADDASGSVRSIGRTEGKPDAFASAKVIVVGPLGRAGPLDEPATLDELVFLGVDGVRAEPDDSLGPSRTRVGGRIEGEACRPVGDPSSGSEAGNDGRAPLRRRFLIASLLLGWRVDGGCRAAAGLPSVRDVLNARVDGRAPRPSPVRPA